MHHRHLIGGSRPFGETLGGTPADIGPPDRGMQDTVVDYAESLGLDDDVTRDLTDGLDLTKLRFWGQEPATDYFFNIAVATLLISLCPNIVTLRVYGIEYEPPRTTGLGEYLMRNNYGRLPSPTLQKLRNVQLHPVNCLDEREYVYIQSLGYIRYFHRPPAVEALSLEGLEEYQSEVSYFPPKCSSALKEIRMSHVDMSDEMIGTIIRVPKVLEAFSLSTNVLQNQYGRLSILNAEVLGKCLSEHKHCLKSWILMLLSRTHPLIKPQTLGRRN